MGYEAHLELRDHRGARWVGGAAPGFEAARDVFEALIADPELDPANLTLPPGVRLEAFPPRRGGAPWDRASAARQVHLLAHRVRAIGVAVPRPLAYVEAARSPRAKASFRLVGAELEATLGQWWALRLAALREADPGAYLTQKRLRIRQAAVLLRTLEAQGYLHSSLTPASFEVAEDHLVLRDLELHRPGRRARPEAGLAALDQALSELGGLTRADRMRFLRAHQAHRAGRSGSVRRLWRRVAALEQGAP